MLQAGQPAPAFVLPDADMDYFDFQTLRGKYVVLFFYPRDDTPGCITQATEFSDHEQEFLRHKCVVLGISRDDCITHAEFRDKHGLSVRLLADTEGEVCQLYDVWQSKEVDGVKRMGILRSTFVIDRKGIVRHAIYGVTPRGHAADILQLIQDLERKENHADREKHGRHSELPGVGSGRNSH